MSHPNGSGPRPGHPGRPAHPNAPAGGGGQGKFKQNGPLQSQVPAGGVPHHQSPAARPTTAAAASPVRRPDEVTVVEADGLYTVTLDGGAEMRPFLRTTAVPFEDSVRGTASTRQLAVVINGNMFSHSGVGGLFGGYVPSSDPASTTPEGVIRGRDRQLGGVSEPNLFYVTWAAGGQYTFGFGDPPAATSAVGGVGPLIINGLKYGRQNEYRRDVPAGAPASGPPGATYQAYLTTRSNATYASFAARGPQVGKTILAHGRPGVRIIVQPQGGAGTTLDAIRDRLVAAGFTNAVFLDGSDSAMLYANGRFYVRQGGRKNTMNTIGIGFHLPARADNPPHLPPTAAGRR